MWYQQQLAQLTAMITSSCDLLKNIYLCGINNNLSHSPMLLFLVVICLKISTFVVSTTTNR
nr:hypothetical protein [Segatella oulorum]